MICTYHTVFSEDDEQNPLLYDWDVRNEIRVTPDVHAHLRELSDGGDRIPVALHSTASSETLVVYARSDERKKDSNNSIYVPIKLVAGRLSLFAPDKRIRLAPVRLVPLSAVVVATSPEGFACFSQEENKAELVAALRAGIVRQGDTAGAAGASGRIVLTEPVRQGTLTPETEVIILSAEGDFDTVADELATYHDHSGVLPSPPRSDRAALGQAEADTGLDAVYARINRRVASSQHAPASPPGPPPALTATPLPLQVPVARGQVFPAVVADADTRDSECDVNRLYTRDFSAFRPGDMVVVRCGDRQRVVRALQLPKDWVGESDGSQGGACGGEDASLTGETLSITPSLSVLLPPPLLFNLGWRAGPLELTPLSESPSFPLAQSLTVARVASAHSVNRVYEGLFLDALKHYFQLRRRVHAVGDIICVGICEGQLRFGLGAGPVRPPFADDAPDAMVSFKVTAIEAGGAGARGEGDASFESTDNSILAPTGALPAPFGYDIDPAVTKLVQRGVVQSLVPDAYGFLGITCHDAAPSAARARLSAYVAATLRDNISASFGLALTVLLKGAPGAGKATLLRSVARRCGFHVIEIDAFDLIGESDVKTEGVLRARVERALACAPCVLILRHIEALARKGQALETGQEPAFTAVLKDVLATGMDAGGPPLVVAATTADADKLTAGVLGCFKEELSLDAPTEPERLALLTQLTRRDTLAADVSLRSLAVQTAALVAGDLADLVRRARVCACAKIVGDHALSNMAGVAVAKGQPEHKTGSKAHTDALNDAGRLSDASDSTDSSHTASSSDTSHTDATLAPATFTPSHTETKSTPDAVSLLDSIRYAGVVLTAQDFATALDQARSSYSANIGAPKIPNVTWDDVGGLAGVKDDILDTIQLPLERPELFADGLKKRSGILLYGPPGTGKTLVAKAVATSCSLNFFSVKGPELLNMYIGESEANVRRVFARARDASPCVIFFDELDSVAPKRGNQGDSGGVMDRIVSQLLAELDGMASGAAGSDVFVIGATNRPDLLDPALLRPGRFDKLLYLGVSETHEAQLRIIEALTRKFKLAPNTNLENVANRCPFHYTGADFYALCSDAMLKAMTRKAGEIDQKVAKLNEGRDKPVNLQYFLSEMATDEDTQVLVAEEDFLAALKELVPSVSSAEMEHYRKVQQRFSDDPVEEPEKKDEKEATGQPNSHLTNGHTNSVLSTKSIKKDKGKGRLIEES